MRQTPAGTAPVESDHILRGGDRGSHPADVVGDGNAEQQRLGEGVASRELVDEWLRERDTKDLSALDLSVSPLTWTRDCTACCRGTGNPRDRIVRGQAAGTDG
jgi:hypothetical protein